MWIRSQDDELIVNLDHVAAIKHHKWIGNLDDHEPTHAIVAYVYNSEKPDFELGRYYSPKRVGEILDEIEDEIDRGSSEIYCMPVK